jgi:hypothetical protein
LLELCDRIAGRVDVIDERTIQVVSISAWDGNAVIGEIRFCILKTDTSGIKPGTIGDLSNCIRKKLRSREELRTMGWCD